MVQDSAHAFQKSSVEGLGHSVVLRSVVSCKSTLRTFLLEELVKVSTGVLASTVGTESLDLDAVLGLSPGHKVLVGL